LLIFLEKALSFFALVTSIAELIEKIFPLLTVSALNLDQLKHCD